MIPFQITFLDIEESDAVWIDIENRIESLETISADVVRCQVLLACPHRKRHTDRLYHVQIRLSVPGDNIFISHDSERNESHRDIFVAIRDAFRAAERKLLDRVGILRKHGKNHHSLLTEGKVIRIFDNEQYGFLETEDGREIYFGNQSLPEKKFALLTVGQKVRFYEVPGHKGPLATSMVLV